LKLQKELKFKEFSSIKEMHEYVASKEYSDLKKEQFCFGFEFKEIDNTHYEFNLSFYEEYTFNKQPIPKTEITKPNFFQSYPQPYDIVKYGRSGFLHVQKIFNEYIMKLTTGNDSTFNFGIIKYTDPTYIIDYSFNTIYGNLIPSLLTILFNFPMYTLIFRMVKDKESKLKEGMKMMGLIESSYILSYLIGYLLTNTYYALTVSIGLYIFIFPHINPVLMFLVVFLFGLFIFSFAFLFQSLLDRTRVVSIVSILIYYLMNLVSYTVIDDNIPLINKSLLCLIPQSAVQLAIRIFTKYEESKIDFGMSKVFELHGNFSVLYSLLWLFFDSLLYLFIGYYLQNVLSHEYGVRRKWNFLCTKSFWVKAKKNKLKLESITEKLLTKANTGDDFEDESAYQEKLSDGDCLKIENLKKEFDDGKVAVDRLSLNLYKNEIFALLGHNGAGKSTTIHILSGLYEATGGSVYYENENILEDIDEFRKKVGICPQQNVLFDDLTVREHLEMFCVFKGIKSEKISEDIDNILRELELVPKADALSKTLSGGQKRKLSVAIALVGGSEVVFLDEPSSGMDVNARRNLWEILKRCTNNRIIILTTHYMEEASTLGKRIGIMSDGKLQCCGSNLFLIKKYGKHICLNIIKKPNGNETEIVDFIKKSVRGDIEIEILSEEIIIKLPLLNENSYKQLFLNLDSNLDKLNVITYGISMPTLEDVFLNLSSANNSLHKKGIEDNIDSFDKYDAKLEEKPNCVSKFFTDLTSLLKARLIHSFRDKKAFTLEVLCPLLLVLISLLVSSGSSRSSASKISSYFLVHPF
jgi:ATP-binding cassette subfamily A (ABC1) protein 3